MKRIFNLICATILTVGCQNQVSYKDVREDVIVAHDKLMADEDKTMNAKMALDTLASTGLEILKAQQADRDTAKMRSEIKILTRKLNDASDQMSKWMENFKSDVTGKSNAEAVAYFKEEKLKVKRLDSLYQVALKE